jgi:DNA-binding NarL/FixJ family response regulator
MTPLADTPPGRCLLIEDQQPTREWMHAIVLQAFPGMTVTTAASVKEALACLDDALKQENGFALALVDLGLPDGSGIEIVRRIAALHPATLAVVATVYDDDAHLFEAITAGARGYLLKSEERELLIGYLRRIDQGEPPLSPTIAHRMLAHFRNRNALTADDAALSPRENETLMLLARGLTVAETASHLGLTRNTVASYVKLIYQKLNVGSRAEATREAVRRGLA